MPVAGGLVVNGVATYAFLGLCSRLLLPAQYASLGVLWSLLFAVGNGIMQPLEQEVARASSARRARGEGAGPVIRRAAGIGAAFTAVIWVAALLTRAWVLDPLLDANLALEAAFLVGLAGFGVAHLSRGALSSHGRFRAYGVLFGTEGISRFVLAAVLGVIGIKAVGAYGAVVAIAPFLGAGAGVFRQRGLLDPGPQARWSELTAKLGWLLMGTGSLSLLLWVGTIAVEVLQGPGDEAAAGSFLNGLQIARIPLFLFQAVLASLLPRLSHLAAAGDMDEFGRRLRSLVLVILGLGLLGTAVIAAVGPTVMRLLFGEALALGPLDLAMLSLASVVLMAAICLDQALIALNGHARMAFGWVVALVTFVVVTALGHNLFLRVELGLVSASCVALVWMGAFLVERVRHHARVAEVDLPEAVSELPVP